MISSTTDTSTSCASASRRRQRSHLLWRLFVVTIAAALLVIALWTFPLNNRSKQEVSIGNGVPTLTDIVDDVQIEQCSCAVDHPSFASTIGLEGTVSDCCCSFADLERTNQNTVHPLLQRIVATPFFAHFKIDLCSTCELWTDAPLCVLRDCGVCECEAPPDWADEVEWMPDKSGPDPNCEHIDDQVITTVEDSHVADSWPSTPVSFLDALDPLSVAAASDNDDDSSNDKDDQAVVVDLRRNPERYTGYAGPSADKVWSAIHSENCFRSGNDGKDETDGYCSLSAEQRVYNRMISGLHSSISLHIAHSYCLEMDPDQIAECKQWGANATLAHDRVLDHKDRLENLYVVFAVLLRAVQKAGDAVTTAVPQDDPFFSDSLSEWTDSLRPQITKMAQTCPLTFDETSLLLEGSDSGSKRLELHRRWAHLLKIMTCVGCDRCRLWGTVQTMGIGTALRVLLQDSESSQRISLSRQEAVALIHTLERFSSALVYAHDLKNVY